MSAEIEEGRGSVSNYWRFAAWGVALCLLLLPLVAMQLLDEVAWTLGDFVFAAVMIGGTGLAFEIALRVSSDIVYRLGFAVALGATFLLVWINAAVGIIGSAGNDANFLYAFVLLFGVGIGAAGGLRPRAMAKATGAAALVQALVTAIAIVAGLGLPASPPLELLAINAFFIAAWVSAAILFRRSARRAESPA